MPRCSDVSKVASDNQLGRVLYPLILSLTAEMTSRFRNTPNASLPLVIVSSQCFPIKKNCGLDPYTPVSSGRVLTGALVG